MVEASVFEPTCQAIKEANSFLILLPPEPSADIVSAGLGLYHALESTNKAVQIGCSGPIKISEDIIGIEEIRESVGNQNLSIAFDFPEENLEKVDYDVDANGKFVLFIKPKKGHQPPATTQVKFSYSGAEADLVFVIGINSLAELGKLYADEKAFLDNAKTVSLKTSIQPSNFASISLHQPASSISEIVTYLVKLLKLRLTSEASNNLLSSIASLTHQFSAKATADTFELVAYLMRSGATLHASFAAPPVPTFDSTGPTPVRRFEGKKPKIFRLNKPTSPTSSEPVSRF